MTRIEQKVRETSSSESAGGKAPSANQEWQRRPPHLRAIDALEGERDRKGDTLDQALDNTFPASDPVSATRRSTN